MTMVGIAQGYQPLISYYFGKGRMDQCGALFRYGIFAVIAASAAFTLVCITGTEPIVRLFISSADSSLLPYSVHVFRIFALSFLFAGYNVVIGAYFTAVERPAAATVISLSRGMVMLCLCLLVMTMLFGGTGIWWSPLVSEILSLVLTLGFLIPYLRSKPFAPRAA